jgi:hypothetical protein
VRAGGRATTATVRWKLFSIASKDARVVWLSRRACRVHSVQVLCMLWLKRVRTQRRPRSSVPYLSRFFFLVLLTSTRSPSATEETTLISSRLVWTKQVVLDLLHDLCAPLSIFTLRLQSQHTTPKENKSRRFLSQFNPILFACGTSASCHSSV